VEFSRRADCDPLSSLTKTYVAQRSVTPIRRADESALEIGRRGRPTTDDRGVAAISLKGMCRGMYRADGVPGWLYESCAEQIGAVEMKFRALSALRDDGHGRASLLSA
jgi:hypothetical protein